MAELLRFQRDEWQNDIHAKTRCARLPTFHSPFHRGWLAPSR